MNASRTGVAIAAFAIGAVASFASARRVSLEATPGFGEESLSTDSAEFPEFRNERQWVLLYVGRSSCRWCTSPEMRDLLEHLRGMLPAQASAAGASLRFQAIGVDHDVQASLDHLKGLGRFDAIAAGDAWLSIAAGELAWGDFAGPRSTPQILLVDRMLRVSGYGPNGYVEVLRERLLARKIGLAEIDEWVKLGAPWSSKEVTSAR